jgi:hypothetical protein
LGNAWILVDFLDLSLDIVLFLLDAGEANLLPANANSSANPAKKICRWGDHERGIRRTADQTSEGCQYKIGIGDDNNLQPGKSNHVVTVSYMEGVAHKVEVTATALYETVGFGLKESGIRVNSVPMCTATIQIVQLFLHAESGNT